MVTLYIAVQSFGGDVVVQLSKSSTSIRNTPTPSRSVVIALEFHSPSR